MRARLFARIAGVEARRLMAYRFDFWVQAVFLFAVELGIVWFLWTALFSESGRTEVGGFTRQGALLYYGLVILVGRIVRTGELDGGFSTDVYEGGLSRYLLYPVPYLAFKYAQQVGRLAPAAVQVVLFGVAVPFLFAGAPEMPTLATLALAVPAIVVASLLNWLIGLPLEGVSFWADNVWGLVALKRMVCGLLGGFLLPLSAFPPAARGVIEVLPFRHLYWDPVNVLLGRATVAQWAAHLGAALLWCAAFGALAAWVFARGRRRYTGVGI